MTDIRTVASNALASGLKAVRLGDGYIGLNDAKGKQVYRLLCPTRDDWNAFCAAGWFGSTPQPPPVDPPVPPVVVTPPTTAPFWQTTFAASPWYKDFDGNDQTVTQDGQPQHPTMGLRVSPDGSKAWEMPMSQVDATAGDYHSKLYKTFGVKGKSVAGLAGLGGDYKIQWRGEFFWPTGRKMQPNALSEIMGWKEIKNNRGYQESMWWATVISGMLAKQYPGTWLGSKAVADDQPVLITRYWNDGKGSDERSRGSKLGLVALPTGRWFELRADVFPGSGINWYVDGQQFSHSDDAEYHVMPPTSAVDGQDEIVFEPANYGNGTCLGSTWVRKLSATRF